MSVVEELVESDANDDEAGYRVENVPHRLLPPPGNGLRYPWRRRTPEASARPALIWLARTFLTLPGDVGGVNAA